MEHNGLYENAVRNINTDSFKRVFTAPVDVEDVDTYEMENVDVYDYLDHYRRKVTQNRPQLQNRLGGWLSHNVKQEANSLNNFVRLAAQS